MMLLNWVSNTGKIKIYVLLAHIIYVIESGRFSQSPAFLKRAGLMLRKPLFITATAILHCTFYPALLNT